MPRYLSSFFFFFNDTATTEIYTLSLHDALPISLPVQRHLARAVPRHGAKTQPLQHLAQGLGLAGRVLDELYAVDPEAIGRLGHVFPAAGGGIGHCGTPDGNMVRCDGSPGGSGLQLLL